MPGALAGLGRVAFWGLSPAQDLLELVDHKIIFGLPGPKKINILLAGEADTRHAFKTLYKNWELLQKNDIRLNFYIAESFLEQYARQLLFWTIALQPLSRLGLREKTAQFMELYGNSHVRPQTNTTLTELVDDLIKMTTNEDSSSVFDMSQMKFRERDALVDIFKQWRSSVGLSRCLMSKHWSGRVARHLGTRYDARGNVYDWDYNMNLLDRGARIVSAQEYKKWRETGIAFAEFDADYSQPNLTLVTGNSGLGQSTYLGEIVTGPFISHGIEAEDGALFEKANERYKHKSYDVTFHNLERIFEKISPHEEVEDEEKSLLDMICLHFISPLTFGKAELGSKVRDGPFDIAFFGNSMAQHIGPSVSALLSPDGIMMVENAYFILESRPEHGYIFEEKVTELAVTAGLELIEVHKEADEPGFPCFLQFGQASVTELGESMKGMSVGQKTDEVDTRAENAAGPLDEETSAKIEDEAKDAPGGIECSPKGDAPTSGLNSEP